jgi:hypothetical protein
MQFIELLLKLTPILLLQAIPLHLVGWLALLHTKLNAIFIYHNLEGFYLALLRSYLQGRSNFKDGILFYNLYQQFLKATVLFDRKAFYH